MWGVFSNANFSSILLHEPPLQACSSPIIIIIIILILARMETFYSSTCISTLLVFEFLISFLNVCIFTDYVK